MKLLLQIVAIVVVGYMLALLLPWWFTFAIAAFLFGFVLRSGANFFAGAVATAILWGAQIWLTESSAAVDLAARVADLFPTKTKAMLIAVTIGLAALIGGFAALSGALLKPKRRRHEMRYR